MNQKELVRELREMHEEVTGLLKQLIFTLQNTPVGSVQVVKQLESVSNRSQIQIEESIMVTKTDSNLDKGYDKLVEPEKKSDETVSSSISKLKKLKKGD